MPYPKIVRNRYRVGETDNRQHSSYHHEEDMRDFHLPLAALHQRYLHTWGICSGLEVSGTPGSGEVTVQPGVAIDAEGRMIVLADEGLAQNQEGNLVTVPVFLTLSELPAGQYYVTLTYAENEQPEPGDTTGRTRPINVRQAPLVRLETAVDFVDNGVTLILGVVEVDEAHHLAALSTISQRGGARRLAGQAVMTLEVRRPRQQGNDQEPTQLLSETIAGALAPWPSGGLHLTVANDADQIAFSAQSGNNFAGLQIRANETQLQGDLAVQGALSLRSMNSASALRVSIDADSAQLATTDHALTLATAGSARLTIKANGNVGIGTVDPQSTLEVDGRLNARELYVNGAALATLLPAPSQWTTLATGIAFTTGKVGINTLEPAYQLDVNGKVNVGELYINDKPLATLLPAPSQWRTVGGDIAYASGNVGIGTTNPQDRLDLHGALRFGGNRNRRIYGDKRAERNAVVVDGHWDALEIKGRVLDWTGSNLHIGYDNDHSTDSIFIGNGKLLQVAIQGSTNLIVGGGLHFGARTRQMINLWTEEYGIGIQGWTQYFRTDKNFAWYRGGAHRDNELDGGGGTRLMALNESGVTVRGAVGGGETATGWYLGAGAWGPDNWLRLTTTHRGGNYHDFAVNHFWSAGHQRFDLAEVTPVVCEEALEPGDVVVIDRQNGGQVRRSTQAYDRAVYGIISSYAQAALVIGGGDPHTVVRATDRLPVALVGRVMAKVSTENGAIQAGDLLTTAATAGCLMKCPPEVNATGAIAGKALEALATGTGKIMVLVTLQ